MYTCRFCMYIMTLWYNLCKPRPVGHALEVVVHHVVALTEVVVGARVEADHDHVVVPVVPAAVVGGVPVVHSRSHRGMRHVRQNVDLANVDHSLNVDRSLWNGMNGGKRTTTADMRVRSAIRRLLTINLLVDNRCFSEL